MKHISHEFVNQFDAILPSMIYIGMHDKCRHCGKSVGCQGWTNLLIQI